MIVDEELDNDLRSHPTFKNNNTVDDIIAENKRVTRPMTMHNEDSATTMINIAEGDEIPRRMNNNTYYFSDMDSI